MAPGAAGQAVLTAIDLARAGRFTELRELFIPALRPMVVPEALQTAWLAALRQHGPITSIGAPITEPGSPGVLVVKIPVICERGAFGVVASATEQGQLAGLQLTAASATEPTAAWQPPDYADVESFEEQVVTLGSDSFAVRDYQVTVEDDLARWKEALDDRPDVSIRVYSAYNHLFAPGSGPCTPAEYEPAHHVDAAVIADMAEWLKA